MADLDLDRLITKAARRSYRHGTAEGAEMHAKRGSRLCDPCRAVKHIADGAPLDEHGQPKQVMTEQEWQAWQARRKASGK